MKNSRLEQAMLWLSEKLADGPMPAAEIMDAATHAGHSAATLRRARERLGIVVVREGFGPGGRWLWRAPSANDVQTGHLTCSEIDGIGDDLAGFSFDLRPGMDEAMEDALRNFSLSEEDLAFLSHLPVPARRRR
jgi:hypothetical protein